MTTARRRDDDGFTLLEVIVTTTIMSVVMVVVLGGLVHIYSLTNKIDNTATSRSQLATGFNRLDKEIRYAVWVANPGQVGAKWYLEYAIPTRVETPSPAPTPSPSAAVEEVVQSCRQLVYDNGRLTLAAWDLPGTTPGQATTIASELSLIGSTPPFTVYPANVAAFASASPGPVPGMGAAFRPEHTQVRLRFNSAAGNTTLPFDVMFTAQNNDRNSSPLHDCSQGRPSP